MEIVRTNTKLTFRITTVYSMFWSGAGILLINFTNKFYLVGARFQRLEYEGGHNTAAYHIVLRAKVVI